MIIVSDGQRSGLDCGRCSLSDVRPGDEVADPAAPFARWLPVVAVSPATRTLLVEDGPDADGDAPVLTVVGVGEWQHAVVLRRVPTAEAALRAGAEPLIRYP